MHKWIRFFRPRDYHELTSSLLIQLCYLSAIVTSSVSKSQFVWKDPLATII